MVEKSGAPSKMDAAKPESSRMSRDDSASSKAARCPSDIFEVSMMESVMDFVNYNDLT